jgi:hypothetical protein
MEIEQLKQAAELMRRYEGRDAAELLPPELPTPVTMQPNKEYIRQVIAEQVDITAFGTGFVGDWPDRYLKQMETVNDGGVPSERVVQSNVDEHGRDYRVETEGAHPIERLRAHSEEAQR